MQTIQEILTTAQNERLDTLLQKRETGQQIVAILTTPMQTPRDTAHALIQAALAGGGADNVSAIVAEVSQV